jgi:hypothetical protein
MSLRWSSENGTAAAAVAEKRDRENQLVPARAQAVIVRLPIYGASVAARFHVPTLPISLLLQAKSPQFIGQTPLLIY